MEREQHKQRPWGSLELALCEDQKTSVAGEAPEGREQR